MKFNPNGFLVQDLNTPYRWFDNIGIEYLGLVAFYEAPLLRHERDSECRQIQREAMWKSCGDGYSIMLHFISNLDLLYRYIEQCKKYNIPLRLLFIESTQEDEIWNEPLPKMRFMGYEYNTCPIDNQILTDLVLHESFKCHKDKLNEYGLFSTLEDALSFKADYDKAFAEGIIGDGDMETFIFRISEVEEV